jgi:DnaJ-class molecular chaperone
MSNLENCKDCSGTGVDSVKQVQYEKTIDFKLQGGTVRCWSCNGNGLEPYYPRAELKMTIKEA